MTRNLVPRTEPPSNRIPRCGRPHRTTQLLRDRLVEENLGFVIKVACEHRHLGLPLGDLINEGCLGLIEAARRFDPNRGIKFVTYAAAWVRKSILRALLRYSRIIRIPAYHLGQVKRYQRAESTLANQLGHRPERGEVSRQMDSSEARVDAFLSRRILEVPLDSGDPTAPGGSLVSRVEDKQAGNPEDDLLKDESRLLVDHALSALTGRERLVIECRFGLGEARLASLAELGMRLGLSRERVRQIEHEARQKMRRALARKRLPGWVTGTIIAARTGGARQPERPRPHGGEHGMPG